MINDDLDVLRTDTWASMVTGLGTMLDKSEHLYFRPRARLDYATLDALYDEGGLFARIIDLPPDDMTRAPCTIESPGAAFDWSPVTTAMKVRGLLAHVGDAIRWSRLYGLTLLAFDVDDGRDPSLPLDLGSARSLSRVYEIEAEYLSPGQGRRDDPATWIVGGVAAERLRGREIHRSRVVRYDGVRTSPSARARYGKNGSGPSVGDRVIESLKRLETVSGYAANIMHELSLPVLKIEGLRKMLANPQTGRADVQTVLQSIKDSIDILHMLAIDKADEFVEVSRETRGLVELLGVFQGMVQWSTDAPKEIVFNETEGGLNTGENAGAFRSWYDRCAKRRGDIVDPAVLKFIEIECAVRKLQPPVPSLAWAPLWQPTPLERAQAAAAWATSDNTYYTMGAVTEDEVRRARFVVTQEGGFAVDDDPDELEPTNLVALPGGAAAPEAEPEAATPAPSIDVSKALEVMVAAQANTIPRDGAIALLRIAFPQLAPVVEQLVPPPPPPVDPNAVAPDDPELEQADYDPPDTPLTPTEMEAQHKLGISAAVLRGMHKRGEIGAWRWGARWKYSPSEVKQAGHRPAVPAPPVDPNAGSSGAPPAAGAPPA